MTAPLTRLLDAARAAKKVAPGIWSAERGLVNIPDGRNVHGSFMGPFTSNGTETLAAFIAAASPETVETLCEVIEYLLKWIPSEDAPARIHVNALLETLRNGGKG